MPDPVWFAVVFTDVEHNEEVRAGLSAFTVGENRATTNQVVKDQLPLCFDTTANFDEIQATLSGLFFVTYQGWFEGESAQAPDDAA